MPSLPGTVDRFVLGRPGPWLWGALGLTLVLGAGLPRLEIETDGAAIHPSRSPTVQQTARDRDTFAEPDQVIVLLTSRPDGPPLASPTGFRYLRQIHDGLQTLEGVPAFGVRSIASLLGAPADPRSVAIRPLLDLVPDEPAFRELLAEVRRHPLTDGLLLSSDDTAAAVYVRLDPSAPRETLLSRIERWIESHPDPRFEARVTGPVVAEVRLGEAVVQDLVRLVPAMVVVIAVVLGLLLRSPGGVLVPLAEVLLVLVWTLGAMGWIGAPVTLVTTILPVVLMTMALADEIHLLERHQIHLGSGGAEDTNARRRALASALGDVGWPIAVTSLTTAVALLSFLSASTAPIRHFGIFCALGILLAMLTSFTLVPACVMWLPSGWFVRRDAGPVRPVETAVLRHRWLAPTAILSIVAASLPGLLRLRVQDSWTANFDPDSGLVAAERAFNDRFWGSYRFDLVLESERPGFFRSAEGVGLLGAVAAEMASAPHAGGVAHHLLLYEALAHLRGDERTAGQLPPDRLDEIATLANFVRRLVDLESYLASDATSARVRLFVADADYAKGVLMREWLAARLPIRLEGSGVQYHMSGDLPVALEVVDAIVHDQLRSLGWTSAAVTLLLALALRSVRLAALAVVPAAAAIGAVLGAMGAAGIPLGIATSMFAALAIGLGVDFVVHLMHAVRRERLRGLDGDVAARNALAGSRGVGWSAVSLAGGFAVLALSSLPPNHLLGLLLAAATLACWGLSRLWFPFLVRGVEARERRPGRRCARPVGRPGADRA